MRNRDLGDKMTCRGHIAEGARVSMPVAQSQCQVSYLFLSIYTEGKGLRGRRVLFSIDISKEHGN